jgi:hypothetical protein
MAVDEGIEASMASVKLQETEEVILIRVGGTQFSLDQTTIALFQSNFLNTLLNPESAFKKPDDGVYNVDANEECFSVFLHMVRYGSLPTCMVLDNSKESVLIQEAGFWGIETKVQHMVMQAAKRTLQIPRSELNQLLQLSALVEMSKVHHNWRNDDCNGRIYCDHCSNRDIDSRWYPRRSADQPAQKYTDCKSCNKTIYYKPNLGWCHKCSLCTDCQSREPECPADCQVTARNYYGPGMSTAELKEKLQKSIKFISFQG